MSAAAPDAIEPVVGWRMWRVLETRAGFRLQSIVYGTVWPAGGPMTARCFRYRLTLPRRRRRAAHEPPGDRCTCGVYAAPLAALARYVDGPELRRVHRVIGQVALWGDVVEAEHGWRAQLGYPVRLFLPAAESDRAEAPLAEVALALTAYRVPVEIVDAPPGRGVLDALRERGEP